MACPFCNDTGKVPMKILQIDDYFRVLSVEEEGEMDCPLCDAIVNTLLENLALAERIFDVDKQ